MNYLDLLMMQNVPPFPKIRKDSMQQIMTIDNRTESTVRKLTKSIEDLTKELKSIKTKKEWNHRLKTENETLKTIIPTYPTCSVCGTEELLWNATIDKDDKVVAYDELHDPWCSRCETEVEAVYGELTSVGKEEK